MLFPWNSKTEQQALLDYFSQSLHVHSTQGNSNTNLELARIYREAGRKIEYQVLAAEMEECWGIALPAWSEAA